MKNKTSIIILTYNKLKYTKVCINSIRKYTNNIDYEIIVVDNGSTDDTVEWIKEQKDIRGIFNNENKGFSGGCNQGIKIALGTEILLLNNDTIVVPNWLNNLQKALRSSEKVGAVGPVTNNAANYQSIKVDYKNDDMQKIINFGKIHNEKSDKTKWHLKMKLIGFCMLIKKEVIDHIGLLDEQFFPGNFEDDDYSLRIISAGYNLLQCNDTFIHHFGSISFEKNDSYDKYRDILVSNNEKFYKKWNIKSITASDGNIIEMVDFNNVENVLQIGCACGAELLEIKNNYPKTSVYGIEKNKYSVKFAQRYCSVVQGDIENIESIYERNFFDCIIISYVLFNIRDTVYLLKKIKPFLKKNGCIILKWNNLPRYNNIKEILTKKNSDEKRFYLLRELRRMFFTVDIVIEDVRSVIAPYYSEYDENKDRFSENLFSLIDAGKINKYQEILSLRIRQIDNYKICFITCVNDEKKYKLCVESINKLNIPQNYSVEIKQVKNAKSMTAGYNNAMLISDAKYKVYLHQDVIIVNRNLIYDMLRLFMKNNKIGIMGVVGVKKIPLDGTVLASQDAYGCIIHNPDGGDLYQQRFEKRKIEGLYEQVQGADGNLLMTQYDILWREDIFTDWHFYDFSQCMEFIKKGYKAVVPNMSSPWNIHKCGKVSLEKYTMNWKVFLNEYKYILKEL